MFSGEGDQHPKPAQQPNQKQVIQQQYVTFKPHTHLYTSPVLKKGTLGNLEPKEPEPPGVPGGPGEGAKPFVLGPEYKDAIQASIKEFGFNMVASDMISLDRTISDIRHEELVQTTLSLFYLLLPLCCSQSNTGCHSSTNVLTCLKVAEFRCCRICNIC